MSIADFFIEYGIDPTDPFAADQICSLGRDDDDPSEEYSLSDVPDPSKNDAWSGLCADDRWKHKPASKEELYYCEVGETDPFDYWGENSKIKAVPSPEGMHRGALAPKWVFETTPTKVDKQSENSLETYMQRLICAITGRFVVIERNGAMDNESLNSSNGQPQVAVKYRWRYWDNEGNVYDVHGEKCRQTIKWDYQGHNKKDVGWDNLIEHYGGLPGDFRTNPKLPLWMQVKPGENAPTYLGEFWDATWLWKYDGTTYCSEWDQRLSDLARLAGVPMHDINKNWPLKETELDAQARVKEWEKLECKQPAMASYRKDDIRLNFYLSTGTVGSCLDHPNKGKTQLFRKYLKDPMSLFDNPRQHTEKGYYTKNTDIQVESLGRKRKAQNEQCHTRSCPTCGKTKPIDEFSKNQRRKGPEAKFKECVQA
jgi:hypothetical protein